MLVLVLVDAGHNWKQSNRKYSHQCSAQGCACQVLWWRRVAEEEAFEETGRGEKENEKPRQGRCPTRGIYGRPENRFSRLVRVVRAVEDSTRLLVPARVYMYVKHLLQRRVLCGDIIRTPVSE